MAGLLKKALLDGLPRADIGCWARYGCDTQTHSQKDCVSELLEDHFSTTWSERWRQVNYYYSSTIILQMAVAIDTTVFQYSCCQILLNTEGSYRCCCSRRHKTSSGWGWGRSQTLNDIHCCCLLMQEFFGARRQVKTSPHKMNLVARLVLGLCLSYI